MNNGVVEVLIVEDNRADVKLVEEALNEAGLPLDTSAVSGGEEALAYLRSEGRYANALRPDLVIVDLHLPGMSGMEFLDAADERIKGAQIVILSGSPEPVGEDIHMRHRRMMKPGTGEEFDAMVGAFKEILIELREVKKNNG